MTTAEIKNMSTAERLRAMEVLWDALCESADEIESPDWHGQILEERRKRIKSGDAQFVSIAELKKSAGK